MADLHTRLCGIGLTSPVLAASGTFGYGLEFTAHADFDRIGAIAVKGLSSNPLSGNPSPRITETASGMLNSVGLQNVGVSSFVKEKLPSLAELGVPILANVFGFRVSDYVEALQTLEEAEGLAAYEMNVSCPNTHRGGIEFGASPATLHEAVRAARSVVQRRPLLVKLSPNVSDIVDMARAAVEAGADGLSLINTLRGLAVDARARKPRLGAGYGGLSGPAIKPVALYMVHRVAQSVDVPIVGAGGAATGEDIAEFILCGATAVQVGTASFWDPGRVASLTGELEAFLDQEGVQSVGEIRGTLEFPAGQR